MLAIVGGKGGCGKTTTTLGIARTMARAGESPLVVDADVDMPDVHHVANIDREYGVDRLGAGEVLDRAIQRSRRFPGVALVTGGRREHLARALTAIASWDGPVLVDTPAGINPDATQPLRHADAALAVSTDEPQCLEDVARSLTAAHRLQATPIGVCLRTVVGSDREAVAGLPVIGRTPTVDAPFEHSAVEAAWMGIADALTRGRFRGRPESCYPNSHGSS